MFKLNPGALPGDVGSVSLNLGAGDTGGQTPGGGGTSLTPQQAINIGMIPDIKTKQEELEALLQQVLQRLTPDPQQPTPVIVIPGTTQPDLLTCYTFTYDAFGSKIGGVLFEFTLVSTATGDGYSYSVEKKKKSNPLGADPNASALLRVDLPRGSTYDVKRADGEAVRFRVPTTAEFSGTSYPFPKTLGRAT